MGGESSEGGYQGRAICQGLSRRVRMGENGVMAGWGAHTVQWAASKGPGSEHSQWGLGAGRRVAEQWRVRKSEGALREGH